MNTQNAQITIQNYYGAPIDGPPALGRLFPGQSKTVSQEDYAKILTHPGVDGLFSKGWLAAVDVSAFPEGDPRRMPPTARCRWFLENSADFDPGEAPKDSMLRVFDSAVEKYNAEFSYDPLARDGDLTGFVNVHYVRRPDDLSMVFAKALTAVRRAIAYRIRKHEEKHGGHTAGFSKPR